MTFNSFDVVVVPFPFTERTTEKRRPALILSKDRKFHLETKQYIMAMITSSDHALWPFDLEIEDLESAGLSAPSKVRMKLFTLDQELILRKIGVLSRRDQRVLKSVLRRAIV